MTETDRRQEISRGDAKHVKKGDVFYNRHQSKNVVVVEVLDSRYARVVDQENPKKSRLWRLTYLASSTCELQPHASPDEDTVADWESVQ